MIRVFWLSPLICIVAGWPAIAHADWDDRPGFDFHPQTSAAAPCGVGTPPRGHFAGETSPAAHPNGVTLIVKQDANRLCYVSGNVAEAPVIRIRQGAELKITLRNEITDPTAIAHYVAIAHLGTPNPATPETPDHYPVVAGMHHAATGMTNLHVHGFAVPPIVPQDEVMKTCVDPATGPAICGRREFSYDYKVPETMPAGLYWYHPHVHGEVQAQMLMGLSGAIVVEGADDDARRAAGIQDKVFIVRQAQDLDTKMPAPAPDAAAPMETATAHRMPVGTGNAVDTAHELACSSNAGIDQITLNGSKVVNGKVQDGDLAHYEIADGSTQLWRFLNAATDAFLDLAIIDEDGAARPIAVVARDGAPITDDAGKRLPATPNTQSQLVPPGGRLEFLIAAPPVGHKAYLVTHAVDTGCAGDRVPERTLALITAAQTATPSTAAAPAPPTAEAPDLFSHLLDRKTDRERTIALAEYPRPGSEDQTDFYIAERKPGAVLRPYTMGDPPAIAVAGGTTEEWVIENWTNELHAFHIHQIHFRLLAVNGKPEAEPPLLDVVNVPYATVRGATGQTDITTATGEIVPGRIRIKLYFPEDLAGDIPFHCHLVDHEDNGMMGILRIAPRQAGIGGDKHTELSAADLPPAALLANPPICRPVQPAAMSVKAD